MRLAIEPVLLAMCLAAFGCSGSSSPPTLMMVGTTVPCTDPMTGAMRGTYSLWCDSGVTTCEFRIDGRAVSTCTGGASSQSCIDAAMTAANACVSGTSADGGMPVDGAPSTCGTLQTGSVIPPACLPRCMPSTRSAYNACAMNTTCESDALEADLTPPAMVDNGRGGTGPLDCSGCSSFQTISCIHDACPSEFDSWNACALSGCPDELALFRAAFECANAHPGYAGCRRDRVAACFP